MRRFILAFLIILSISFICAHQPRFVVNVETSVGNPIIISNPELSQAFYGELKGSPDFYLIESEKPFNLYVNVLAPEIYNTKGHPEFIFQISGPVNFSSEDSNWTKFYEEFAGDSYYRGSEFDQNVSQGVYLITVLNQENSGKYSLATGKLEQFSAGDWADTIPVLFNIKVHFFEKPAYSLFQGIIGKILLGLLIFILVIIILVLWLIFRKKKKRN